MANSKINALFRVGRGIKAALIFVLALPWILFMLPIFWIYRWTEVRAGRPAPTIFPFRHDTIGKSSEELRTSTTFKDSASTPASATATAIPSERNRTCGESPTPPTMKVEQHDFHGNRTCGESPTPPTMKVEKRDFHGKSALEDVVLITGGARRLGAIIALDLASQGYPVAIGYRHSRNQAEILTQTILEQGGEAAPFAMDLRQFNQMEELLDAIEKRFGSSIKVLINNAALFSSTTPETHWEETEELLQVNLQAPLHLSLITVRRMIRKGGGQIINLCDIWGERPLKQHAAYNASKAGLLMVTRTLARDFAPKIRVNAIAPGALLPPENQENNASHTLGFQKMTRGTLLARTRDHEAILKAVHYLLSADFVTGEVLHVDGGRSLG